jgi:uncharacterized protein YlzI (FlbEa/FlbD family)
MTDPLDDRVQEVINPIDTFARKINSLLIIIKIN